MHPLSGSDYRDLVALSNAGQGNNQHTAGTGGQTGLGRGCEGGARCHHIVNQQNGSSLYCRTRRAGTENAPTRLGEPLVPCLSFLATGRPSARQRVRQMLMAGKRRKCARQQGGLVVAAPQKAAPMQGTGTIRRPGSSKGCAARASHGAAERASSILSPCFMASTMRRGCRGTSARRGRGAGACDLQAIVRRSDHRPAGLRPPGDPHFVQTQPEMKGVSRQQSGQRPKSDSTMALQVMHCGG